MKKKRTRTFKAYSDDGREFTIHEYTDFIESESFSSPKELVEGLKELRTSDGKPVKRIEKGKYEIRDIFGRIIVHSDSPDAP